MQLQAKEHRLDRSSEIKVEKLVNQKSVNFFSGKFQKHTDFEKAAKRLSVSEEDLIEIINTYNSSDLVAKVSGVKLDLVPTVHMPSNFTVREERQSKQDGTCFDTLAAALQVATPGTVVEWEGISLSCCLDVDFDEDAIPSSRQLLNFAELLQPRPMAFNLSKSGGLHVFYNEQDGYAADELASVAAYHLLRRFPQASFEFLSRARGTEQLYTAKQSSDIGVIKSLLLDGSETDNASYLESRSLKPGTRLSHTECPVNPSTRAKGNSGPVIVYDDHYFCYICERDGRKCGSNIAGYFPFSAVSGGRVHSQIHRCVTNFVHWGHAKQVFRSVISDLQLAKRIYSTLLKLKHGQDPRIPLVFSCGEPNGLVRYQGHWRDYEGSILKLEKNSQILASLPHCMELNRSHGVVISPLKLEWMSQTIDQTVRGYPAVTPIRGYQFTQWQELPENVVYVTLRSEHLQHEDDKRQPRYLNASERLSEDDAFRHIDAIFPGVDRKLIYLLLAGRGCTEHHSGLSPMLFLTGPTGSGKTGHVEIAAAICGDGVNSVKCNKDSDRFDNKLYMAKSKGAFVFLDEFFKFSKQSGQTGVEAMENLLLFNPSYLVYMIHVGSIPLGQLPFFLWADTEIDEGVLKHEQIGRRVYHYRLPGELDWKEGLRLCGGKPIKLRNFCSDEVLAACNTILSIVADLFFTGPVTDFSDCAEFLQVAKLRDSDAIVDKWNDARELFKLVCQAKDITDVNDKRRFSKKGFKIAKDNGTCPIYAQLELCELGKPLEEGDLKKYLNLKYPAKLEIRKHGSTYALRFVERGGDRVNGELLT